MTRSTRAALAALALTALGFADARTQQLLESLNEQLAVFAEVAPKVASVETLTQRALVKSSDPKAINGVEWRKREIKSDYAWVNVGDPPSLKEVRRVIAVDGKPAAKDSKPLNELGLTISATSDKARRKLLERFEKFGLVGAATDFGQLLLLFARPAVERYAIQFKNDTERIGAYRCVVFTYTQNDGPGAVTVFDAGGAQRAQVAGEIWVERSTFQVMRVTLATKHTEQGTQFRDEAQVDYVPTLFGTVLPSVVVYKQFRGDQMTADNRSTFEPFHEIAPARTQ